MVKMMSVKNLFWGQRTNISLFILDFASFMFWVVALDMGLAVQIELNTHAVCVIVQYDMIHGHP